MHKTFYAIITAVKLLKAADSVSCIKSTFCCLNDHNNKPTSESLPINVSLQSSKVASSVDGYTSEHVSCSP